MYYICRHDYSFNFFCDKCFPNSVPERALFKYFHKQIGLRKCKLTHRILHNTCGRFHSCRFSDSIHKVLKTAKLKQ